MNEYRRRRSFSRYLTLILLLFRFPVWEGKSPRDAVYFGIDGFIVMLFEDVGLSDNGVGHISY